MQIRPFASVLASASGSQLQREATCSGRRFNCRHDSAEWPLQVASPFRQPYVNSVLGSALISIPGERSISKGSPTQFPSLRYVSPLDRGARFRHQPQSEVYRAGSDRPTTPGLGAISQGEPKNHSFVSRSSSSVSTRISKRETPQTFSARVSAEIFRVIELLESDRLGFGRHLDHRLS